MRFIYLEFNRNYFILTREDNQKICFPYSKIDHLISDNATGKLRIEIRKYGTFFRDYDSTEELVKDSLRLMAKGGGNI